jgi:hypothetical protein
MREKERLRQERVAFEQKTWMDRRWFGLKVWIVIALILLMFVTSAVAI